MTIEKVKIDKIMKGKVKTYVIAGVFLSYFGLKGEFVIWYNGIALVLGISAFVLAYIEYRKEKDIEDGL